MYRFILEYLCYYMDFLINLFNSNFFVGAVTLLAGSTAFYLYITQKRDHKKDAANILLLEIQNAGRLLGEVREHLRNGRLPSKFLMPTDSWDKYKYLFVRDFDRDEWDSIANFYHHCKLYDQAVSHNSSFFQKNEEQIRVNMHKITSNYLKADFENQNADEKIEETNNSQAGVSYSKHDIAKFQEFYLSKANLLLYEPRKPLQDAQQHLDDIRLDISQTSIGLKLKKMAKLTKKTKVYG